MIQARITILFITFSFVHSISGCQETIDKDPLKEPVLPCRENLWVFIMAGQSNMAGRGEIEAQDLVTNERILSIDAYNHWVVAREPLHFYKPGGAGLDCGLSFGKELITHLPDSIYIAMIPCAVGGSSVYQWLGDSLHRDVRLYSNFKEKVGVAKARGVIKCILWHQGERDANEENIPGYPKSLKELFSSFRKDIGKEELPIIMGELGTFVRPPEKQEYFNRINDIIHSLAREDEHSNWISSEGLDHKGDHLHFDSKSQRELGRRYAEQYLEIIKNDL